MRIFGGEPCTGGLRGYGARDRQITLRVPCPSQSMALLYGGALAPAVSNLMKNGEGPFGNLARRELVPVQPLIHAGSASHGIREVGEVANRRVVLVTLDCGRGES